MEATVTVAGRKAEYMIRCGNQTDTVMGYRVSGIEWARLFVYESNGSWVVSEIGTGCSFAYGPTRKAAVESAVVKLTEAGEEKFKAAVAEAEKENAAPAPAVEPGVIKLGRVKKGTPHAGQYVGRGSALGNPFRMKKETDRIPCILKYRAWLHKQLQDKGSKARAALSALVKEYKAKRSITLLCYCPPLPCHSEVIANAIRYCAGEPTVPYTWTVKK